MSGPLAALSPVSMIANLAGGKGLLGKKKSTNQPASAQVTETRVVPSGASPSSPYAGA